MNHKAVCRIAPAEPGLLNFLGYVAGQKRIHLKYAQNIKICLKYFKYINMA